MAPLATHLGPLAPPPHPVVVGHKLAVEKGARMPAGRAGLAGLAELAVSGVGMLLVD